MPLQPVVVGARDGMKLVCYLSRPREIMKGTPGPMVLLVHGGPWARDGADAEDEETVQPVRDENLRVGSPLVYRFAPASVTGLDLDLS